jgi:hypothetical protein
MHRFCLFFWVKSGALFFYEKFRSERTEQQVAENALILANHPLL